MEHGWCGIGGCQRRAFPLHGIWIAGAGYRGPQTAEASLKLHHLGMAVANLETAGALYAGALGLVPQGPAVNDAIQQVRVQFWARPGDAVLLELIEPLTETSPTAQQVRDGGGYAHLCYEVSEIEFEVQAAWERGAIVVRPPVPAAAFGNRRIAFVCFRDVGMVEFVEKNRDEGGDGGA